MFKPPKIRIRNPINIKKHYDNIKHSGTAKKLRHLEREYIEIYDLLKEEWLNGIDPTRVYTNRRGTLGVLVA